MRFDWLRGMVLAGVGLCGAALPLVGQGIFPADAAAAVHRIAQLPVAAARPPALGFVEARGVLVAGADVFTAESEGRWTSRGPTATLTAPPGSSSNDPAATNGSAIVTSAQGTGGTKTYVYAKPSGGWVGAVGPSATLVASTGTPLAFAVISGRTIAATGQDGAVYVFTEPAGGWSGTVSESARLVDPAAYLGPAVIVGHVIYAVSENPTGRYAAFSGPTGGWTGTIRPTGAILTGSTHPPITYGFGDGLVAGPSPTGIGAQVLRPPAPRKTGAAKPIAYLDDTNQEGERDSVLLSSKLAVLSSVSEATPSTPSQAEVSVITKPSGGWSGSLGTWRPLARAEYFDGLAVDGRLVFVETSTGPIKIYRITGSEGHRLASVRTSSAIVRGAATSQPRLSFRAISTTGIRRLSLRLPAGLSVAGDTAKLRHAVTVDGVHPGGAGEGITTITGHGRLITLSDPLGLGSRPRITIGSPALRESAALRRELKTGARHVLRALLTIRTYLGATQRTAVRFHAET